MDHPYLKQIKIIYPDLSFDDFQTNDLGQNNDVIILNKSLVFRFPKYKAGISKIIEETKLLEFLRNRISVAIPCPVYQSFEQLSVGKVFMGYPLIQGSPLWKADFTQMKDGAAIQGLAAQLVAFLQDLHSVSPSESDFPFRLSETNPREEMASLFVTIQSKLFPYIREDAKRDITASFEHFLESYSSLQIRLTLIHGDFGASNILWDAAASKICGIIDFGSSCLGDPAYDFAGLLSSYGEDFYSRCIALYPNGAELSERVEFYRSTFPLQEALHGLEHRDSHAFNNGLKEYI